MGESKIREATRDVDPPPVAPQDEIFSWRTFDPAMLTGGQEAPLASEFVTYRDHLDEMLRDHEGDFVVIKGDRIVGFYSRRPAAIKAAFRLFGREPVLVKQVVEVEPIRRLGGFAG